MPRFFLPNFTRVTWAWLAFQNENTRWGPIWYFRKCSFFLRLSSILNKSTPIWNHICLVRSENRQSSGVWCDPSKLVLNCSMFMALQLIIDSQIDFCCRLISRWINFFIEGKREKEDKEEAARDPDKLQETSQTDTVHSSGWQDFKVQSNTSYDYISSVQTNNKHH